MTARDGNMRIGTRVEICVAAVSWPPRWIPGVIEFRRVDGDAWKYWVKCDDGRRLGNVTAASLRIVHNEAA